MPVLVENPVPQHGVRATLRLTSARTLDTGVVNLTYGR